jgi:tRNA A-37 threonylcarbamoyl transferase component Bud32
MEVSSIEGLCNALARYRVLAPEHVRAARQRWLEVAGANGRDLERFKQWLVANKLATEHQIGVLVRGHGDQLWLGPYRISERVGRGRMAGVYRAVHESGQTVAIKVLPPSKARDAQILGRFQRESRLALKLKHPNIVRTFQTGQANGLYYLVMEHLEGETLEEVLQRRKRLAPDESVRLIHQALQALQQIHEQGLVHRDLKPANLFLVGGQPDSTRSATVKILDIGMGRALFDEGPGADLTNDGDILGTPEYMAPEQARDPRGADIRADIYGLGCVLYHTLAGQPPFVDKSPVRLLVRIASEDPRPVRELNPAVPEGLQQILDWMLTKDPAARYPTPERAAQALQVFLSAAGPTAPEGSNAQMSAYLRWLAAQGGEVEGVPVAVPVAAVAEEVVEVNVEPVTAADLAAAASPARPARAPRRKEEEDPPAKRARATPATDRRRRQKQDEEDDSTDMPETEDEEHAPAEAGPSDLFVAGVVCGIYAGGVVLGLLLMLVIRLLTR